MLVAAALLVPAALIGCQGPDELFRHDGGSPAGEGGSTVTGRGGSTGAGGSRGGSTGAGGNVSPNGGSTGRGGFIGTGVGGSTSTGGTPGAGGQTVTGAGGATGTGGGTGAGGGTGTGGSVTGAGGSATGVGGATGAGPCAGLCATPIELKSQSGSGSNSPAGACYETTATIQGAECTNAPGFKVNAAAAMCKGTALALPPKVNGGYCLQFATSDPSYGAFSTY